MVAKNTLLKERSSAFGQRGSRLGIQIAIQKVKISSTSKICDMSDRGLGQGEISGLESGSV